MNFKLSVTRRKICLDVGSMTGNNFASISSNGSDFFLNSGQNSKVFGKTRTRNSNYPGGIQLLVSCCNSCGEKKKRNMHWNLRGSRLAGKKKVSYPFVFVAATNVGLEDIFSKKFARPYSLLSSFDKKLFNALPSFCSLPPFCKKSQTIILHTCSTKIENGYNFFVNA